MVTGRIGVPLERAAEIAHTFEIESSTFIFAVLNQRYPSIDWDSIFTQETVSNNASAYLSTSLSDQQDKSLCNLHERTALNFLKALIPDLGERSLTAPEMRSIMHALRD
jgi:hypothetical protein